MAIVTNRRTI